MVIKLNDTLYVRSDLLEECIEIPISRTERVSYKKGFQYMVVCRVYITILQICTFCSTLQKIKIK